MPPAPTLVPLAILDGYAVRWSRETVARDIVQNFFDEVADFRDVAIDVDAPARTVRVSGPSRFDLDYLRYLGATTKSAPELRTAGGFGEGFKICALVLLRDYGVEVAAGSGAWEIRPVLRPMKLGRELCYEVTRLPRGRAHPGSFVELRRVDRQLAEVFGRVREMFRHPGNPRLANPIYVDKKNGIGVYAAADDRRGDLFYRRQHRGRLRFSRGSALTFAYDQRIEALDADRDRRDLRAAAPVVVAIAALLPDAVIEQLVRRLRMYWQGGNSILSLILREARDRELQFTFPRRWLARERHEFWLEQYAQKIGCRLGIGILGELGMPTVTERFGAAVEPRPPTPFEAARIDVAREFYRALCGQEPMFKRVRVVDLKPGREHSAAFGRSCTVLAAHLAAPFAEGMPRCLAALAVAGILHEHRNAVRLTSLLAGAIRGTGTLRRWERRWDEAGRRTLERADRPADAQDADEEDDDDFLGRIHLHMHLLAPSGFPPADLIEKRLEALAREVGAYPVVIRRAVNGPRTAAQYYARGVPSVVIGDIEIEPPRRGRAAYEVRTFTSPRGPALVPDDAVLREAVVAVTERTKRTGGRISRAGRDRAHNAYRRWLRRHDPLEYRKVRTNDVLWKIRNAETDRSPDHWPHELKRIDMDLAKRAMLEGPFDEERLPAAAAAALARARQSRQQLLAALEQTAPGITGEGNEEKIALGVVTDLLMQGLREGGEEGMTAAALAAAPWAVQLGRIVASPPLDEHCARDCAHAAKRAFIRAYAAGDPLAALERAAGVFEVAVRHALERHERTDERGEPLNCWNLSDSLDVLLDEPKTPEKKDLAAEAVRAAWDEARRESLTELEAARRCLDAALPFDGLKE